MKVALCLSGQPRFVNECYPSIKKNIIDVNGGVENVDTFVHTWRPRTNYPIKADPRWENYSLDDSDVNNLLNLYKPVDFRVEDPIVYKNPNIDLSGAFKHYFNLEETQSGRDSRVNASYSMFYSILQSHILMDQYRLGYSVSYDYVIRCRTDVNVGRPIVLSQYDPSMVWYEEMGQPDGMVSDWLNFGGPQAMAAYASVFVNFDSLVGRLQNRLGRWCNEMLIKEVLDTFGIEYKTTYNALSLPRL